MCKYSFVSLAVSLAILLSSPTILLTALKFFIQRYPPPIRSLIYSIMRVCVCNDIDVDHITETARNVDSADAESIFRVLGKRFACGNCRSLVSSVAELSLRKPKPRT